MTVEHSDTLFEEPTPPGTALQFWIRTPGQGTMLRKPLAPRQEGEVLVRTHYSAISRGTEALVFRGEVPPSQYESMRAPFQEGRFPGPVKYGYTSVGRVVAAREEPGAGLLDRMVFCLYPHQDLYHVPATAVTPLPPGIPPERAILGSNMETAVNAVWDAGAVPGDRIAVVGGGVVGLLIAWLCQRTPGTEVIAVDTNASRALPVEGLGARFSVDPPEQFDADVVFHASGQPEGLRTALQLAGDQATVVEASWYGDRQVPVPLGEAFHSRRLRLVSTQVGRVPPTRAPRWSPSRRLSLALDLLRDPWFDDLITSESEFEQLPEVLERLSREPGDTLCHRIRYSTNH